MLFLAFCPASFAAGSARKRLSGLSAASATHGRAWRTTRHPAASPRLKGNLRKPVLRRAGPRRQKTSARRRLLLAAPARPRHLEGHLRMTCRCQAIPRATAKPRQLEGHLRMLCRRRPQRRGTRCRRHRRGRGRPRTGKLLCHRRQDQRLCPSSQGLPPTCRISRRTPQLEGNLRLLRGRQGRACTFS